MASNNTIKLVRSVISLLNKANVAVLLGGGWAEELYGLIAPRPHKDVDLYYVASDFKKLDQLIKQGNLSEIIEKRMPHKRAFLIDGVMVEVILISKDSRGYYSNFWGKNKIMWPHNISDEAHGIECLSVEALQFYRSVHDKLF